MLQMLWHFLSSLLPRAGCQGSREGSGNEVRGSPAPARGDQMPSFLGKQDGRAEAAEKRPTILLVVGPADQFPKLPCSWRRKPLVWSGRYPRRHSSFQILRGRLLRSSENFAHCVSNCQVQAGFIGNRLHWAVMAT